MRCLPAIRRLQAALSFFAWVAIGPPSALGQGTGSFGDLSLMWVRPTGTTPIPCARLLVLDAPRDWMPGDAAAVLLRGQDAAPARPVVAALLAQQVAVLEFPSRGAEGCTVARAGRVEEAFGALRALSLEAGAGIVIVIGLGEDAGAALRTTEEAVAAQALGADGPRAAAAAAEDGVGGWDFRAGRMPPAAEHWQDRVPHLCAALAGRAARADEAACLAALLGTTGGPMASLPGRR
ncbi:hypothetical protein [Roseomonas rosulenta]|uniref:hypothetical protein n=1 Tax=Roseomonas rosulenta TaxID=2748667 RepID=UPI0018DFC368|nr:hypothetical protein [Roseomonas rosulenta]